MEYKEAVQWFSGHMLKVLEDNGDKEPLITKQLFRNMLHEMIELHEELCKKSPASTDVIQEAVDVANYALMIALDSIGVSLEPIRQSSGWPAYRYE